MQVHETLFAVLCNFLNFRATVASLAVIVAMMLLKIISRVYFMNVIRFYSQILFRLES